eukprot:6300099-Alexandrium_andersonii.AAC.1
MPGCCCPTPPCRTRKPCSPTRSWARSGRPSRTARCAHRPPTTRPILSRPGLSMSALRTPAAPRQGRNW